MKREKLTFLARCAFYNFFLLWMLVTVSTAAWAEKHTFNMNIVDTQIRLVGDQTYHTFAFNGQVPGPLIHIKEGDHVTVNVTNLTTLTHTIHWHGLLQMNSWRNDGVPGVTQKAIQPGDTFTYEFVAEPSGTMWYHCHVNTNEHVAIRGMWGPIIIDPKDPLPIEEKVTKEFILMLSGWSSKWAHKPGEGGIPGDVFDYFTINAKAYPETQPIRVEKGDVIRLRLIGAGDKVHSIHIHGHLSVVAFKDGRPLPNPYEVDTLLIGPGERYSLILTMNNPGLWMLHDHIDLHTVNGTRTMGGLMTVIEYKEIGTDYPFYEWKDKKFIPNFYYEVSMEKPYGMYNNPAFKGKPLF